MSRNIAIMTFTQGSTCCHLPVEVFICQQLCIYSLGGREGDFERVSDTFRIPIPARQSIPTKTASIFEQVMFIKSNLMSNFWLLFAMIHIWMSKGRSLDVWVGYFGSGKQIKERMKWRKNEEKTGRKKDVVPSFFFFFKSSFARKPTPKPNEKLRNFHIIIQLVARRRGPHILC